LRTPLKHIIVCYTLIPEVEALSIDAVARLMSISSDVLLIQPLSATSNKDVALIHLYTATTFNERARPTRL